MTGAIYVTGNPEKAENFSRHIGMEVPHEHLDLDEIQTTDDRKLVEHKVRQAFDVLQKPVIVEDVAFSFEAWGDLPGPFVKFFVGVDRDVSIMCRMLDGFENRRAIASCTFGHFDGKTVMFFTNSLEGTVAKQPRGGGGFGFDRIFEPDGFEGKTAAELDVSAYENYYLSVKPMKEVRKFLKELYG